MQRRPPWSSLTDTLCPSSTLCRSRLLRSADDMAAELGRSKREMYDGFFRYGPPANCTRLGSSFDTGSSSRGLGITSFYLNRSHWCHTRRRIEMTTESENKNG